MEISYQIVNTDKTIGFLTMKNKINQYLDAIEKEKQIKILLACETGSRAWGFPSPDSDYDVRIIYMHPKDWYLSLTDKKDSIQRMLENNEIDITGWDLRKSLRLLMKSNPPLLERIQSTIIYRQDDQFVNSIVGLANNSYSRISTIHHYLSMAKKFLADIVNEKEYKLKKFFYALRSATACLWILKKHEIPPISFLQMINGLDINKDLVKKINQLISLKSTQSETYFHSGESELFEFIHHCISLAETGASSLPSAKTDLVQLDQFFIKMLDK